MQIQGRTSRVRPAYLLKARQSVTWAASQSDLTDMSRLPLSLHQPLSLSVTPRSKTLVFHKGRHCRGEITGHSFRRAEAIGLSHYALLSIASSQSIRPHICHRRAHYRRRPFRRVRVPLVRNFSPSGIQSRGTADLPQRQSSQTPHLLPRLTTLATCAAASQTKYCFEPARCNRYLPIWHLISSDTYT